MASIHIGTISVQGDSRTITAYFHVTVDVANYPGGQVSALSALEQGEIDALNGGTLYEHKTSIRVHKTVSNAAVSNRLKNKYANEIAGIEQRLIAKYKFYGTTIEVP